MERKFALNDMICMSLNKDNTSNVESVFLTFLNEDEDDSIYKIDGVASLIFLDIIKSEKNCDAILEDFCEIYGEENRSEIFDKGYKLVKELEDKKIIYPV